MSCRFEDPREAFSAAGLQLFERGWLSSNGILFPGRAGDVATLVDSGYATHASQTVALVRRALGDRTLRRVLNTHLHSDHCGGNAALQEVYGCEAWVPAGEVDKAQRWDRSLLTYDATGQQCPRFSVYAALQPGGAVELGGLAWEIIASPGHDPESVVLYQRDLRILLSADALWENGFGVVFPELEGLGAFDTVGLTLDRLAGLAIDWVVPGHGRVFGSVEDAIERARRRLDSFRLSPDKHALHAAKVLVKFHLLELGRERLGALHAWGAAVPYLAIVQRRYFGGQTFAEWFAGVVGDLLRSGALRRDDEYVCDAR